MQTKQTPFFSFLLALFLMVTFISNELGLIGLVLNYLFIYILAFFASFISKQQLLIIWGLMFGNVTFNQISIVIPMIGGLFPTMKQYVYTWQYFALLESMSMGFMFLHFFLAWYLIKRKKICERVGKCFRI